MGNCCKRFAGEIESEEKPVGRSLSVHSEGHGRDNQLKASTSLPMHARIIDDEREQQDEYGFHGYYPGFGRIPKGSKAELVAAGWPSLMVEDAGEAFRGWLPRKEQSFANLEKIGEGTYSIVYRALDLEQRKVVALKKIKFEDLEPGTIRFMAREIEILRRLHHPNIIKLEGLVASEGSCNFYLVFEYMEHDLAGLASHPGIKFTESQIKCYMKQLLCGLDYCHRQGILHRDIKGSNLLLDNKGNLKIADFGLANFYDPEQVQPLTTRVVTLWYRPPELLLGATCYGGAVDLWSAGCILAELYAGGPIFPGRTEVEQLHRIFMLCGSPSEDYLSLLKLPPAYIFNPQKPFRRRVAEIFRSLPAPALALIEMLLSIDPSARQSATHALNSEFFLSEPLPCKPEELPKYPSSKELNAIVRDEEAKRQAAGEIKGDRYDVKGKRTTKSRFIPALDTDAEIYLSMLKRRAQDNCWGQESKPRRVKVVSAIPMALPRPQTRNKEISGPEGILHKGASHSGALAHNNKHASAQVVSQAMNNPAYDSVLKQNDIRHKQSITGFANEDVRNKCRDPVLLGYGSSSSKIHHDCVPKQNDSRHMQSIAGLANEDVRNRYRDPVLLGYYGSRSSNIHYSRPLPAPACRPDEMTSRRLPAPACRPDEMTSRRLPAPACRPDEMTSRRLPAPVGRPDEMTSRRLPAPAGRRDEMTSRRLPAPAGRPNHMHIPRPSRAPENRLNQMLIDQDHYGNEAVRHALDNKVDQTRVQGAAIPLPTNVLSIGSRASQSKKGSQH